jgi:hypothetical protein
LDGAGSDSFACDGITGGADKRRESAIEERGVTTRTLGRKDPGGVALHFGERFAFCFTYIA